MSTSVKMRPKDKVRLDRLQAKLVTSRGKKVSQQDLLAELVKLGEQHLETEAPLTPAERERAWKRLLSLQFASGKPSREEDVDRDIYGARIH